MSPHTLVDDHVAFLWRLEMEVALEEGVALVDVIGRRNRAWSTALWTCLRVSRVGDKEIW